MKDKTYHIGVEATMEIIGGKWKTIILCHLRDQTLRTSELKRAIPQITQKMLTQQLRELEDDGIVHRKVYQQVPPKVEYSLTERGESLNPILHQLCLWGETNIAERKDCGEVITLLTEEENEQLPA